MTQRVTAREVAERIFRGALAALDPRVLTARTLVGHRRTEAELVAVGKASEAMALGVCDALPVRRGLVVAKDPPRAELPHRVEHRVAGHPFPDDRSLAVGLEIIARMRNAELPVVMAISGGASALAAVPAPGLTLADKIDASRRVASGGASIHELNTVRKHLSAIKGGRLVQAARAPVVAVLLSDVVGDDLATIGGGLCCADPTTFAQALAIAARAGVGGAARAHLEQGARGELAETPKQLSVPCHLVAGPDDLIAAASRLAEQMGFSVEAEKRIACPVAELAARLAARTAPGVLVAGGEPVVALPENPGRGGRAQHTALLAALAIAGRHEDMAILCAGSDGSDGPSGTAGAIVDARTCERALAAGVDPQVAAGRFDSGTALAAAGDLLTTGPTGTNLADLYVVVVA